VESIGRIAVLGAGTMGSRIAALFAAAGVHVLLLDINERLAQQGLTRAQAGALVGAQVTAAGFADGIPMLRGIDWVLEAVSENLEIKRALWTQAVPYLASHAIASSNTSGLSLAGIAAGLPLEFRHQFLGVHFFNPPSRLHLVEVICTADTAAETSGRAVRFVAKRLGKGVVEARDTPNFIANRIGAYFSATAQRLALEGNWTVEEVDALTGPLIGMPRTGTFRLMDGIGLDIWAEVMGTLAPTDPRFELPPYFREMLNRGWLGDKTGGGFYRKSAVGETKTIQALDLNLLDYRPAIAPAANAAIAIDPLPNRLRHLFSLNDRNSEFLRPLLRDLIGYSHQVAPHIANAPSDLDRAMRWGYGWALGPFELEAALG